jgi:hypothetical protein
VPSGIDTAQWADGPVVAAPYPPADVAGGGDPEVAGFRGFARSSAKPPGAPFVEVCVEHSERLPALRIQPAPG